MKYESMKEVSHGFCKKYKILQYKNRFVLWSRWIFQVTSAASSGPLWQMNLKPYGNVALHKFRLRFSGRFANERF